MPAQLANEQASSVELPDWSEVEALPEFQTLKADERKKVATGYADDLRAHAKALPEADPTLVDTEVDAWLTKVGAQWDAPPVERGAAGQIAAGVAKSFLNTLGGALAGFGRLQQSKTEQAERVEATTPEAPLPAAATPNQLQIFSSEDAARAGGLGDGTVFMLRDAATNKMFKRVVGGATQKIVADKDDDTTTSLVAGGQTALGDAAKAAGDTIQTDPVKDKSFWLGDVPNALGSAGAFVATGIAAGPAATALSGVALQMDSAYNNVARKAEEARARGEESRAVEIEGKQLEQMIFQAPIGALESFGVGGAPARFFKATPFGRKIQQGVGRYLFGGTREGLQESVQGALEDVSMRYGDVDPNANPLDLAKRGREFAAGAVVGGPLEMVSAAAERVDQRALDAQRKIMRDEATAVLEGKHPGMADMSSEDAAASKTRAQEMLTALDKAEVPFRQAEIRQEAENEAKGFEADGLTMSAAAAREFGEAEAAAWAKAVEARGQQALDAALAAFSDAPAAGAPGMASAPLAADTSGLAAADAEVASTPKLSGTSQTPNKRVTTQLVTETAPDGTPTQRLDIAPDATPEELITLSKTVAEAGGIGPEVRVSMQQAIVEEIAKKEPVSVEKNQQPLAAAQPAEPVLIDETSREQFRDGDGVVDLAAFNDNVTTQVKEALANGSKVTLIADNGRKEVAITAASSRGLVDDKGQPWGTFPIADGMSQVRIEPPAAGPEVSTPGSPRDRIAAELLRHTGERIPGELQSLAAPPAREAARAWEQATFEGVRQALIERGVTPESVGWTRDAMAKAHATLMGNHAKHGNGNAELLDRFRDTVQSDLLANARDNGDPLVARTAAGEPAAYSVFVRLRTVGSNFAEKFTARELSGEAADLIRDKAPTPDGNRGQEGIPTHEEKQSVADATWTAFGDHVTNFVKSNPAPASAPHATPDQIMRASRLVMDDIIRQRLGEGLPKRSARTGRSAATGTYGGQKGRPSKAVNDMIADPEFRAAVEQQIFGGLTKFVKERADAGILDQLHQSPQPAGSELSEEEWSSLNTVAEAVKGGIGLPLATNLLPENLQQRIRRAVEADGGYEAGSADVLRRIASTEGGGDAALQRLVAKVLLANGDTFRIHADPTLAIRGANGSFNPRTNEIFVDPFLDDETRRWTILHEQTHALLSGKTSAYIAGDHHLLTNDDLEALEEIDKLREYALEQVGLAEEVREALSGGGIGSAQFQALLEADPSIRRFYPLANLHEFFAGVMTDASFQSLLHSIPDPAAKGAVRTLWQRLKEFLRRLVSGKPSAPGSTYAKAFERTVDLVESGIFEEQLIGRFGDDFTFEAHAKAHQRFMDEFAKSHGHESADQMAMDDPELFISASNLFRDASADQVYGDEQLLSLSSGARDEHVQQKTAARLKPLFERIDAVRARTLASNDERLNTPAEEQILGVLDAGKASIEQVAEALRDAGGLNDAQIEAASEAIHTHFAMEALAREQAPVAPAQLARRDIEQKVRSATQRSSARQRFSDAAHWLRLKFQDRFADLEAIQAEAAKRRGLRGLPESEDSYVRQELYHGVVGERLRQLTEEELPALIESVKADDITVAALNEFLYARHATERNKQIAAINRNMPDGGSGMTGAEADAVLAGFETAGKMAALKKAAARVDAVIRRGLDERLDAGLIDQATHDRLTSFYAHYVPLKGRAGGLDDEPATANAMPGFDVRGQEFKRALGRGSRAADILAHVFGDAAEAAVRVEKNKVGQTLLEQVHQNPAPDVWEIATPEKMQVLRDGQVHSMVDPNWTRDPSIVAVKRDGETHYIRIKHEGLRRAFNEAGPGTHNALVNGLRRVTQYVALINTQLNPEFIVSNFVRDFQGAGIRLADEQLQAMRGAILRDTINGRAIKGAWNAMVGESGDKWSDAFNEMSKHGGRMIFLGQKDAQDFQRQIGKLAGDAKRPTLATTKAVFAHVAKFIERANSSVENGIRLSTYVHAREAGLSPQKAAHLARTITINFTRKGEWGSLMNALWVFSNASVQGTAQMALAASRSPTVRKTLAGVMVSGFVLELLNRSLGGEDDDGTPYYDKLPDGVKNSNLVLMLPGTRGKFVKVPLPYGYNVLYVAGRSTGSALPVEYGGGGRPALSAASDVVVAALNAFNPLGGSTSLIRSIVPTFARPFYEVKTNEDFAGRKIVPEQSVYAKFPQPPSQQYFPNVSKPSREITDTINRMTGGDQVKAGLVSVSPEYLDYWLQQITGGVGTFAQRAINPTWKAAAGETLENDDIPFWRRFAGEVPRTATLQRFYDLREAAHSAEAQLRALRQEGATSAQIKAAEQESAAFLAALPAVKQAEKQLATLRKSVRELDSWRGSEKTKTARIEALQTEMLIEAKRALRRYNDTTERTANRKAD